MPKSGSDFGIQKALRAIQSVKPLAGKDRVHRRHYNQAPEGVF